MGLRWCGGQTTRLSPLRSRIRLSAMLLEPSPHVKRAQINALLKVRALQFPPRGKVDRVGVGGLITNHAAPQAYASNIIVYK